MEGTKRNLTETFNQGGTVCKYSLYNRYDKIIKTLKLIGVTTILGLMVYILK